VTDPSKKIVVLVFLWTLYGEVTAEMSGAPSSPGPLTIRSDTMTVKNRENRAVFDENVVIMKGDLVIMADHVEMYFGPENPSGTGSHEAGRTRPVPRWENRAITKLTASGRVRFEHKNRHAEAGEAVYDQTDEKVILTGDPVLFEEDYRVAGSRMTFFLRDDRSIVESSRVLIRSKESAIPSR
jgi:lipopolysaccharide export system protein LptA